MSFFSGNLKEIRKLLEKTWRELANTADHGVLERASKIRLQIRITLWTYPEGKKTADHMWSSRMMVQLLPEDLRKKMGPPFWSKLLEPDD